MATRPKVKIQSTDHPYIVKTDGICGGRPLIKGTRITVDLIAAMFKAGDIVEDILQFYPHLHPAQVYDAISYYLDHQREIEEEMRHNTPENILNSYNLEMDDRGVIKAKSKI